MGNTLGDRRELGNKENSSENPLKRGALPSDVGFPSVKKK